MPDQLRGSHEPVLKTRTNQRRKTVWQEAAKRLLQSEMALRGYSYKQLARALGGGETDQALMTRINRGTFSLAFFLQVLRTMGTDGITIGHLPKGHAEADRKRRQQGGE